MADSNGADAAGSEADEKEEEEEEEGEPLFQIKGLRACCTR